VAPAPPLLWGWMGLWGVVAWAAGSGVRTARARPPGRLGGVESGMVGLLLGLAMLALLIAAVARQDLTDSLARQASYGLVVLCLGLFHLMLRRDSLRAVVGFCSLGLGIQILDDVARAAVVPAGGSGSGAVLAATAVAVALTVRIAWIRQGTAGTSWVSEAHDLHD